MPLHVVVTGYNYSLSVSQIPEWAEVIAMAANSYSDWCESVTLVTNQSLYRFEKAMKLRPNVELCFLQSPPQGALATACFGVEGVDESRPVVVAPGDTVVNEQFLTKLEGILKSNSAAGVATFANPPAGRNWSYLHRDVYGNVLLVSESTNPTEHATSGHFYFASRGAFMDAALWCFRNQAVTSGKYYSSAALNYIISTGQRIEVISVDQSEFDKRYLDK